MVKKKKQSRVQLTYDFVIILIPQICISKGSTIKRSRKHGKVLGQTSILEEENIFKRTFKKYFCNVQDTSKPLSAMGISRVNTFIISINLPKSPKLKCIIDKDH